jgi:hypothetical protein
MYLVLIATDAGSIVAYGKLTRAAAEVYAAVMLDEIEARDKNAIESIQQYLKRNGMVQATTIYGVQVVSVKQNGVKVEFWKAGNDSASTGNAGNDTPRRRDYGASGNNEARPRGSELHDLRENGQFFAGGGAGESEPGGDRDERPKTRKPRRKRG